MHRRAPMEGGIRPKCVKDADENAYNAGQRAVYRALRKAFDDCNRHQDAGMELALEIVEAML